MEVETYTDETELRFGKHKGTKLANVPASYLTWYYEAPGIKNPSLMAYIKDNMVVLLQEQDLKNIKRHGKYNNH